MKFAKGTRRVVVTGMGIVSCLGLNRHEVEESLRASRSGVRFLSERKEMGFRSALSGAIRGFDPKSVLNKKMRKTLPEFGLWAWSALSQAMDQAGINQDDLKGDDRTGLIFGNDSSAVTAVEQVDMLRANKETRGIGSGHIFRLLNSSVTLNFGTILGTKGVSWTISSACASGAMAIGQGAELISSGRQDRILCGGVQEISWQSMCSFDAIGAFSVREEEPEKASRPFDQERDGLVPGGGAAALVLESYEAAKARGASIIGEVLGYSHTSDGYHISLPSGEGIKRAMQEALATSGLDPGDIDLLMAHATSTPLGDVAEARGIREVFSIGEGGGEGPLVCAIKSLTGHEFWMAGASQVVYGLIMARGGFVTGHPNLQNPDPEAECLSIPTETAPFEIRRFMCNAAGFGGTNACLIIGCPDED